MGQTYGVGVELVRQRGNQLHPALWACSREGCGDVGVHRACVVAGLDRRLRPVVAVEERHLRPEGEHLVGGTLEIVLDALASGGQVRIGPQRVERARGSSV